MSTKQSVLALGFFDGVHLGHARLLQRAVSLAADLGCQPRAISFDRPPRSLTAHRPIPLLCSTEQRRALIREQGVEDVIFLPFTEELRQVSWVSFVDNYLLGEQNARALVLGYDCRIGHHGEGTPELLRDYGLSKGFACEVIEPLRLNGVRVSSTYIRGLVAEGAMEEASRFLGHPYSLSGEVRHGDGLGRSFGFPTVNLLLPSDRQWPVWGVYATRVTVRGNRYDAVTNVGIRPTITKGGMPTVESTLFGFDQTVYGETAVVDFHHFLRPEQRFPSVEALQLQVQRDMVEAKGFLGGL